MNNLELVQKLKNIEARETKYNNHYPYNVGYYDGTNISFDCGNLIKSIIGDPTIDQNYTVGRYAKTNVKTGMGDGNATQILNDCSYKSQDFTANIPIGAFLFYGTGSHAGTYVGDGKVIECTTGGGTNKVIYSEVDKEGNRLRNGVQSGKGTWWGTLSMVEYVEPEVEELVEEEPEEEIELTDIENVEIKEVTKEDWKDILERTIYTACESLIGAIGGAAIFSEIDGLEVLGIVGIATIITFAKCVMTKIK